MDTEFRNALLNCETDIDGAMNRFYDDEELYMRCLADFLNDTTMDDLKTALAAMEWDAAFTAVHALKGLAGNMGFIPLFQVSAEMVVMIRAGRIDEAKVYFSEADRCYRRICSVIRENCPTYT